MKTVLIAGAYGFLGRHVSKQFYSADYQVIGIGRGQWAPQEYKNWGVNHWIEGDIDLLTLRKVESSFSIVVNCSGGSSVGRSFEEPQKDFLDTVVGTLNLLEFLRQSNSKARVIHLSSPAVHGICDKGPIAEETPIRPISPYGFHKSMSEQLCLEYSDAFGLETKIVRLFSIYGEGLKKQLLWDACKKFSSNDQGPFWGDGLETRDWLHVDDAATLIFKAATIQNLPRIVNGGTGKSITVNNVLTTLHHIYTGTGNVTFNGFVKTGDPRFYQANIVKAQSLGWSSKVDFATGLDRYVHWFKDLIAND